ncbi:MAG: hypothetical protein WC451_02535, partial [Patescibacteria group bacterium]
MSKKPKLKNHFSWFATVASWFFSLLSSLLLYFRGMREARKIKSSSSLKKELKEEEKQAYSEAEVRAIEAVKEADRKKREIALEIKGIENADKLKIGRLKRIHQKLLASSSLYRKWNSNPNVGFHNIGLASVLVLTFLFTSIILYGPMYKRALADAHTCTWLGATDTNWTTSTNWTCNDGHTTPDSTNNIAFVTNPTYGLTLTSNQTVVGVTSTTVGMNGTFNTNGYSLTVNGDLTWQVGTLNASASEITITGNLDLSGGTFTYGTSNIIMTGAGTTLKPKASNATSFYDLTIQETNNTDAVTIDTDDFNVRSKLNITKGILTGDSRTVTMSVASARYYIGDSASSGTANITFINAGFVDAAGGFANTNITVNAATKTVAWNGSATVKNITVTTGIMSIQSGKLTVNHDDASWSLSCAGTAPDAFNFAGTAVGRMVILRSDLAGDEWKFNPGNCTHTSDYTDVRDSHNYGTDIAVAHGVDSTGNTGWPSITEIPTLRRWTNANNNNLWSDAANWTPSKPTTTEYAYFSSAYPFDCNLDAASTTVAGIISSDYANTLSTTTSNNALTVAGLTWNSGTLEANGSTITATGSADLSAGLYSPGASSLVSTGSDVAWTLGENTFYNFQRIKNGSHPISLYGTQINVTNNLSISDILNGGVIKLSGDLIVDANSLGGSTLINWIQPGDRNWDTNGGTVPSIKFNNSRTVTLVNNNLSASTIEIAQGTLDVSENNYSVTTNTFKAVGGTFVARQGWVINQQISNYYPGDNSFYNFRHSVCNGSYALTAYHTMNIANDLDYGGAINGTFNVGGNLTIRTDSCGYAGATAIFNRASGDQTITQEGVNGGPIIAVNKASGSVKLASNVTVAGVNQIAGYTGTLDTTASNFALTVNGAFSWKSGTFNANYSTVILAGSGNISDDFVGGSLNLNNSTLVFQCGGNQTWIAGSINYNNITIQPTYNLSITGTANIYGDVNFNYSTAGQKFTSGTMALRGTSKTIVLNPNSAGGLGNMQILGSYSVNSLGGSASGVEINTSGSFTLLNDLAVNGTWTYTTGTFDNGNHTVTFNSSGSQDITFGSAIYYNVIFSPVYNIYLHGDANISGNLTVNLVAGQRLGSIGNKIYLGGNYVNASVSTNATNPADVVLNGSGIQTITTSAGYLNPIIINKPSGKAVFTTASGNGVITDNISLTQGTLEFGPRVDGDNTFTITNTKSITTSAGTILRFAGNSTYKPILVSSSPSNRWTLSPSGEVYANYVNVTDSNNTVGTIYAMNTTATNCLGWDTTSDTTTWTAGSGGWSTDANWDNGKPDANDVAIINSTDESVAVTTSENISFGTLTIGGDTTYTNRLTLTNDVDSAGDMTVNSNGTFEQKNTWANAIIFGGSVTVTGADDTHKGTITHGDNDTTAHGEMYHVNMNIGGALTIDTYGIINTDALGYDGRQGTGAGSNSSGGGYGGKGGIYATTDGGVTYGSVTQPTNLGSGGGYGWNEGRSGGGAILLNVYSDTVINGAASSDGGIKNYNHGTGSGGSIYITTPSISGSGSIHANGGDASSPSGYGSPGGGGRVALVTADTLELPLDNVKAQSGAYGGSNSNPGGAGTVYTKTASQTYGSVKIDNFDYRMSPTTGTPIPSGASWQFDTITVDNAGDLQIPTGTTLTIASNSVLSGGSGTTDGFITYRGGTLDVPESFEVSKITLNADNLSPFTTPTTFLHMVDLTVKGGATPGKLSHSANPAGETEVYKMNINIPGNLVVESGGSIDVSEKGFASSYGLGKSISIDSGASYGGKGGLYGASTTSPTYGSATDPFSLGSGGYIAGYNNGGGAIKLTVTGTSSVDGSIYATGGAGINGRGGGSGGSINISTSAISGSGTISVNGGATITGNRGGGGGGRIAVSQTSATSFSDQPTMFAYGGTSPTSGCYGSAGTVYKKSNGQTSGDLVIDNYSYSSPQRSTLFGEGTNCTGDCITAAPVFDSITLSNSGKLALVKQQVLNYSHDLTIPSGTELAFVGDTTVAPNGLWPTFNMTGDLIVSGTLSSTGLGFDVASGGGPGKGSGTTNGGGGGFGGTGGDGSGETGTGGAVYGGAKDLVYLGSPGGTAGGGSGGGHIQLNITGNLVMDGTAASNAYISANGNNGTTNGGGGSGGAIYVWVSENFTADSDSHVFAKGGNGAGAGGGGGGGRIYVVTKGTRPADSVFSVDGGTGVPNSGSVGTYTKNSYDAIPTLSGPANHATNQMQNISMTMVSTDPDGDWLRYRIQMTGQESAPGVPDFGATY